jgi:hypothetical protein
MVLVGCFALAASEPRAQDAAPTLRLVESLKIAGAKEDLSATIPLVAVLSERRVAVFSQPTAQFVFFDSTGRRIGVFGGRGQGPGEFTPVTSGASMFSLAAGPVGDAAWAYDRSQRRFTVISHQRRLVRTVLLPRYDATTVARFTALALLEPDRIVAELTFGTSSKSVDANGRERTVWKHTDSAVVVVDNDGKIERRLATLPPNATRTPAALAGQWGPFTVPFAHEPLRDVSASGDRVAIVTFGPTTGTRGSFSVTVVGSLGDTLASRTHAYTGAAVTKGALDSALKPLEDGVQMIGGSGVMRASADELKYIRDHAPSVRVPFDEVRVGIDGTVWLRRPRRGRVASEYLVLAANGDVLGSVALPRFGLIFHEGSRESVWVTARDEDGFVDVYRFRIEGGR